MKKTIFQTENNSMMNFGGTVRLNRAGVLVFILMLFMFILYMRSGKQPEEVKYAFQAKSLAYNKVNLKKLLLAAIHAAESGGKEVIKVHLNGNLNEKSKGKTFEGANDPVTDADMKSHCAMYYSLVDQFPDIDIISEESITREKCEAIMKSSAPLTPDPDEDENNIEANAMHAESVPAQDVTVWIDPLDATQEFTEKLLGYVTTMVCVAVRGVPVIGVIHKPFEELPQTYWSWTQRGMSSSLLLLKHTTSEASETPSIIVSRSHAGKVMSELATKLGTNIEIITAGGAGYKALEVAAANATAYIHSSKIKKWDICAGDAILRALGGRLLTLEGDPVTYEANSNVVNSAGVFAYRSEPRDLLTILKHPPRPE